MSPGLAHTSIRVQEPLPDVAPSDPASLEAVLNPFSLTVLQSEAP
jgi:hypothetical protein